MKYGANDETEPIIVMKSDLFDMFPKKCPVFTQNDEG